ncbi:aminoglycoside phosphotransferase family protein [Luteimonas lutimaris]|uniref:Phosphotransferase n=1 Tax=Luteimonas lutimaris TaxID=698645 RepID=A0ABP7MQW9_9GAMM
MPDTMTPASTTDADPDTARAAERLAWARRVSSGPVDALQRASADAGFRSYWRGAPDGIVMDSPPALEDVRPWLAMHAVLDAGGVRVPRILARDAAAGFLLLEDLGPSTCLQVADDGNVDALMDAAIAQLLRLQAIACPPGLPAYDDALLRRELGLFREWFLQRHLGVALDAGEDAALAGIESRLVDAALAQPQVLVHRDFMLRNLMPVEGGPAVLDFQDAVRGPIAYDVLSLCRDAFASWPEERVTRWRRDYRARAAAAGLPVPDAARFERDFDLIGVQRHLKVLGIFARLHHRDGKPRYLADAPRFLGYLDTVLPRHPELAPLRAVIDRHVRPALAG